MPILGTIASSYLSAVTGPAFDSIQTATVSGSSTQSITFSSIPSSYKHLRIIGTAGAGGNSSDWYVRFNGDSGNNYNWHCMYGAGGGSPAQIYQAPSNHAYIGYILAETANYRTAFTLDITDAQNTNKNKTIRYHEGYYGTSNGWTFTGSCSWINTAAITSIEVGLLNVGPKLTNGSVIALYGMKG